MSTKRQKFSLPFKKATRDCDVEGQREGEVEMSESCFSGWQNSRKKQQIFIPFCLMRCESCALMSCRGIEMRKGRKMSFEGNLSKEKFHFESF